jgi:hypothetical protein
LTEVLPSKNSLLSGVLKNKDFANTTSSSAAALFGEIGFSTSSNVEDIMASVVALSVPHGRHLFAFCRIVYKYM